MRWYRDLERFYKRGDFYGASEENALARHARRKGVHRQRVQPFGQPRTVAGEFDLRKAGLDAAAAYFGPRSRGARWKAACCECAWKYRPGRPKAEFHAVP